MSTLNERSRSNLVGVHPDLVRVVELAAERCPVPIVVTEGLRTSERQAMLVSAGKSWTLNSRHLTGHAVDLVDADNFGYEAPDLALIASAMKSAATELGTPIVWGGDWKSKDTPHFELDRNAYPASGVPLGTMAGEVAGKIAKARVTIGAAAATGAAAVSQMPAIVPAPPAGATETINNLAGWGKLLPAEQWVTLLVGAAVFGVAALGIGAVQRWRAS